VTVATFDGPNLIIQLPSIDTYDVQRDLYSAWKQWAALSDNLKFAQAFETTGGDQISDTSTIAPYFFCRNDLGWRIRMPESDGEIPVDGNLFARQSTIPLFEQATGFDAFLRLEVSSRAVVIQTGVSGLTAAESALIKLIPATI